MKNIFARLLFTLAAIFAFAATSNSQAVDATVVAAKGSVSKAASVSAISALIKADVDEGVTRTVNDAKDNVETLGAFLDYALDRIDGVPRAQGYPTDLLMELEQVLQLETSVISRIDGSVALFPPATKGKVFKDYQDRGALYKDLVRQTFAQMHSLTASVRIAYNSKATLDAEKLPFSQEKFTQACKTSLLNMNRAIELKPGKSYYERRAQIHDILGNTAAAEADRKTANSLSK